MINSELLDNKNTSRGSCFGKEDSLEIKGVAIIMLLYHHLFCTVDRFEKYTVNFFPFSQNAAVAISLMCKICVSIFAFISAYGLTISFYGSTALGSNKLPAATEISEKIGKRLKKLLIGFGEVFVITQVICAFVMPERFSKVYGTGLKMIAYFILDMLGLADIFKTPTYLATFWYMSTAILIILLLPLFYFVYQKIGVWSILLFTLLPYLIQFQYENIIRYLPIIACGVFFADQNLLVKFKMWLPCPSKAISRIVKAVGLLFIIACFAALRHSFNNSKYVIIWDTVLAIAIILFSYDILNPLKPVNAVLVFLGKHSMNIFLIHNFFRVWWTPKFIYAQPHFIISFLILLALSLGFSLVLTGVNMAMQKIYDTCIQ